MNIRQFIKDNPRNAKESIRSWARRLAKMANVSPNYIRRAYYEQKRVSEHAALYNEGEKKGFNARNVSHYWHKGKNISAFVKPDVLSYEEVRDDLIKSLSAYSPTFEKVEYEQSKDPHLLVIDPADVHIGKLATEFATGNEYNTEIAKQRVLEGIQGVLSKCKGFDIEQILFVAGNDILHTDNAKGTTTKGTQVDTDGAWYDNFLEAKDLYLSVLETLLSVAPVHYVFNPSNHDYVTGFLLSDVIYTYFRQHPNVTFDVDLKHRKYYVYGENLIGTTHGDGAKRNGLPSLMSVESPDWSRCKHRYIYTHHVHHKDAKDFPGCTVESLRSPSGADAWHHKNGFQHAPKAIEGFLHHPQQGQVARMVHLL